MATHYLSIVLHGLPASLALFLGPLQFITPLRVRRPRLHRVIGAVGDGSQHEEDVCAHWWHAPRPRPALTHDDLRGSQAGGPYGSILGSA